ncbi:MAG: phosphoglycerate dehydrogenase [Anaerolineae bacterium]|nr:phosphoglycerate dehydrogenase [Anaerolineae bacterium]
MAYKVLATPRSFCNSDGPYHEFLRQNDCLVDRRAQDRPLHADELRAIIPGYDGVVLGLDECDASVIECADRLRVISRYGAGVDQVDLAAASRRGIRVTNTPGANSIAVAELCIGLMFALARNIPQVAFAARSGVWKRAAGWELCGKTLGIIGLGDIGQQVAIRAHDLGMRVLAYDPFTEKDVTGVERTDLQNILRQADVLTLHCALTPETRNLMSAERLAEMHPGAYIINTARGGLVDEAALYEVLRSGHLGGAAADVFHDDPPNGSSLLTLDNFIATPHIGATTRESVQRMSMMAARNVVAILRGEPCPYVVNAAEIEVRN